MSDIKLRVLKTETRIAGEKISYTSLFGSDSYTPTHYKSFEEIQMFDPKEGWIPLPVETKYLGYNN